MQTSTLLRAGRAREGSGGLPHHHSLRAVGDG